MKIKFFGKTIPCFKENVLERRFHFSYVDQDLIDFEGVMLSDINITHSKL